jgi:hypothetical protein
MGPFGVLDPTAQTHTPGATCAGCTVAGYPQPCPRIVSRGLRKRFDGQGRTIAHEWAETRCPGHVHAEVAFGVVETRCEACGVP